MTGLHDTDIRLNDEWALTQAADGDAPLCSGLECLYQNIILEAGISFMTLRSAGGYTTSFNPKTTILCGLKSRSGRGWAFKSGRSSCPRA